jgi:hypothetical protein
MYFFHLSMSEMIQVQLANLQLLLCFYLYTIEVWTAAQSAVTCQGTTGV